MSIRAGQAFVLFAAIAASLACAYVGYRIVGWIGVGIFGVLMALVAVQVDMDSVAPIADSQNAGLFAATLATQASESRAEKAGRHAQAASRGRVLLAAKILGALVALAGGVGFFVFQLPG